MKNGKLHGLIQLFGKSTVSKDGSCSDKIERGLGFIGRFTDGIPVGPCWRSLMGGSWLFGDVNASGEFTGNHIAYIYPDKNLAMIGDFQNGVMVSSYH